MGLSPKPSEKSDAHPDIERLHRAVNRFREAVSVSCSLAHPTHKQMGLAFDSLHFRLRELTAFAGAFPSRDISLDANRTCAIAEWPLQGAPQLSRWIAALDDACIFDPAQARAILDDRSPTSLHALLSNARGEITRQIYLAEYDS